MPTRPQIHRPAGAVPVARRGKTADRGYGGRWQRERVTFLQLNPLCVYCSAKGRETPAGVVDHAVPHRGDPVLMWSWTNWRASCKPCHDRKTATEDGGFGRAAPAAAGGPGGRP